MKLRSGVKTSDSDESSLIGREDEMLASGPSERCVSVFGYRVNRVMAITHFNIFLYASCFFIQAGTLPYLSKRLNVDVTMFGYLQTMFAVVQLCGGPIFGRFGDVYGGRAALTLAFASAALSYGLMGISYNFTLLLCSRLPSVFMHAMQGGQMVVTDMSDSDQRADALGKLGMSYGIGMVVGPFIGGIVNTRLGEHEAALVSCAGSLISMIVVRLCLPAETKKNTPSTSTVPEKSDDRIMHNVKRIVFLLYGNKRATLLLTVKIVTGLPLGLWQGIMGMVAIDVFQLKPHENGYLMSYIGLMAMLIQGVGIGMLTKRFSENTLIKWASFTLIWSWLIMSFVQNIWQLCVVMVPKCFGLIILNVVVSSTLTKTVSDTDTGTMLGINMAVNSLIRTVSPTIGGLMLQNLGFASFGYFGFLTSIAMTTYLFAAVPQ